MIESGRTHSLSWITFQGDPGEGAVCRVVEDVIGAHRLKDHDWTPVQAVGKSVLSFLGEECKNDQHW